MTRICGTKFFDHDSAVFILDTKKKTIFGVENERVTRIKHDNTDIEPIFLKFRREFDGIKYLSHSNSTFNHSSFSWVNEIQKVKLRKILRKIYSPKYIADVIPVEKKDYTTVMKDAKKIGSELDNNYQRALQNIQQNNALLSEKDGEKKIRDYLREVINRDKLRVKKIVFYDHALCHAAAAYYFSTFALDEKALVFSLDGWGDGFHSKLFQFHGYDWKNLSMSKAPTFRIGKKQFIGSIGTIYRRFTKALGFKTNSDEGKVEALAAYAKPDQYYTKILRRTVKINRRKLTFEMNISSLRSLYDIDAIAKRASKIGKEPIAAAVQRWTEDIIVEYLDCVQKKYLLDKICLSGGVMANVMVNLAIFERTKFKEIYIFPAPGDSGTAAGAAILNAIKVNEDLSWLKHNKMPYFGPSYSKKEIKKVLFADEFKNKISVKLLGQNSTSYLANEILKGKTVALFQGKMEFGPRGLGNRSILSNAFDKNMRDKMNKIKGRPGFQPICPMILEEDRKELFQKSYSNKNMTSAFRINPKYATKLSSAIHVDKTARPQFIEKKDNSFCHQLLTHIKRKKGFGVLLNTSFNKHGRTMVMTPKDALTDFLDMDIDYLYIGDLLISK